MEKTTAIEHTVSWTQIDYLPPRARKPRDVYRPDTTVTLDVRTVDPADLKPAFGDNIHSFEGRYWYKPSDSLGYYKVHEHRTVEDLQQALQRRADETMICVDGEVWTHAEYEPVYQITRGGFGGTHGYTSLGVTLRNFDDEHKRPETLFPADQFEQARARALEIAHERGTLHSLPGIEQAEPSIVYHPEGLLPRDWAPALSLDIPYVPHEGSSVDVLLSIARQLVEHELVELCTDALGNQRWHATGLSGTQASRWADHLAALGVTEHDAIAHVTPA